MTAIIPPFPSPLIIYFLIFFVSTLYSFSLRLFPLTSNMNKKHGVTGPLSNKEPNDIDKYKSKVINEYMQNSNFFESLESSKSRERVLGILNHLVQQFCQGRVHTFGSYRLGVHQKNADIDTLLLAPSNYSHKDFFSVFYKILQDNVNIDDLQKVEDAYVPLIKFKIHNISIDLLFSRCTLSNLKSINLLDDSLLKNMDEKSILSINGSRVTDMLIDLVPNISVFHGVLRCIKYWGKRRGVYGNSFGYPGGVAYAISVARICQFYPNGSVYTVLYKYFELYSSWQWPEPVMLTEVIDRNYNLKVWNPKTNAQDRFHKMPIITPAYPSMCSTHNVSLTTLSVMTSEYKRAFDILKESKQNDANHNVSDILSKVVSDSAKDDHKQDILHKQTETNDGKDTEQICCDNVLEKNQDKLQPATETFLSKDQHSDQTVVSNKENEVVLDTNTTKTESDLEKNKDYSIVNGKNKAEDNFDNCEQQVNKFYDEFVATLAKLFAPSDFFKKYKIYLKITVTDISKWVGFIESKIRLLCNKLENLENYQTLVSLSAIPFPQSFKKNDEVAFFIAIDCKEKTKINIDRSVKSFRQNIDGWEEKTQEMTLKVEIMKKSDVAKFLKMFYMKNTEKAEKRMTGEQVEEEVNKKAKV